MASSHEPSKNGQQCAGPVADARGPPFELRCKQSWPQAPESDSSLRIGSYNIQVDHDRDVGTCREWRHRRPLAAEAVRRLDCDLLLVQEPGLGMAADLRADLAGRFLVDVAACDPDKWASDAPKIGQAYDGNGFIWRATRLELLGDLQTIWLSTTPDAPGGPAWDASNFCRTAVEARFRDLQTGRIWHVFSAHFDHKGNTARVESAKLVMSRARAAVAEGTTVLVAGDFNTFPGPDSFGPETYATLKAGGEAADMMDVRLADKHVDFGVGECSWKGWPGQAFSREDNIRNCPAPVRGQDVSRFDQMFVHKSVAAKWSGVVEEEAWAAASDHVPILAEFV